MFCRAVTPGQVGRDMCTSCGARCESSTAQTGRIGVGDVAFRTSPGTGCGRLYGWARSSDLSTCSDISMCKSSTVTQDCASRGLLERPAGMSGHCTLLKEQAGNWARWPMLGQMLRHRERQRHQRNLAIVAGRGDVQHIHRQVELAGRHCRFALVYMCWH